MPVTMCAHSTTARWGSVSSTSSRITGRSSSTTGSSSPVSAQSMASLSSPTLPPTEVKTVLRLTPACAAMASTVVPAKPRSTNSADPASTIARRVARACSSRSDDRYGRVASGT